MKKPYSLLFVFLLIVTTAESQELFPRDLIKINNTKQISEVNSTLSSIGYEVLDNQSSDDEKLNSWFFQYRQKVGEGSDFTVYREEKAGKVETSLMIRNIYNYHQFINSLAKENYKLKGAIIINYKSYLVFSRKRISFLVTEEYSNSSYYVVKLQKGIPPILSFTASGL